MNFEKDDTILKSFVSSPEEHRQQNCSCFQMRKNLLQSTPERRSHKQALTVDNQAKRLRRKARKLKYLAAANELSRTRQNRTFFLKWKKKVQNRSDWGHILILVVPADAIIVVFLFFYNY